MSKTITPTSLNLMELMSLGDLKTKDSFDSINKKRESMIPILKKMPERLSALQNASPNILMNSPTATNFTGFY